MVTLHCMLYNTYNNLVTLPQTKISKTYAAQSFFVSFFLFESDIGPKTGKSQKRYLHQVYLVSRPIRSFFILAFYSKFIVRSSTQDDVILFTHENTCKRVHHFDKLKRAHTDTSKKNLKYADFSAYTIVRTGLY